MGCVFGLCMLVRYPTRISPFYLPPGKFLWLLVCNRQPNLSRLLKIKTCAIEASTLMAFESCEGDFGLVTVVVRLISVI